MGKKLVNICISAQHRGSVDEIFQKALKGNPTMDFEFPLFSSKDGQRVDLSLDTNPRRDESGCVVGLVVIGKDLTRRKAIENELIAVAGDMTRLIDTANAPIFGIDKDGMVNEWNQTAARITKYSKKEVMGNHLVKTYHPPLSQLLNAVQDASLSVFARTHSHRRTNTRELQVLNDLSRRTMV